MKTYASVMAILAALTGSSVATVNLGSYNAANGGQFYLVGWIDGHDACGDWMPITNGDDGSYCNANFALSNNAGYHIACPEGRDVLDDPNDPWGLQEESEDGAVNPNWAYTCHGVGYNQIGCDDGSVVYFSYQCT